MWCHRCLSMALTDTRSNHGILRIAVHNFVKQKWDTCLSSRSGLLEFWVNFVPFYVHQGGNLCFKTVICQLTSTTESQVSLYVSIDWQSFWGVNQSTIYFLCIGADEVGNWAGSGEILAAAHLFQLRIEVFQTHLDGAVGWSWYPSHLHYPDSPVVLLYNITADHFTLIERVSPAIVIS